MTHNESMHWFASKCDKAKRPDRSLGAGKRTKSLRLLRIAPVEPSFGIRRPGIMNGGGGVRREHVG